MAQALARCRRKIAVKRDGHVLIPPDALFDRLRILLSMNQGFPGIDVLCLMKITVGDERESFQTNVVEYVVAIGDFPGIQEGRELVLVLP